MRSPCGSILRGMRGGEHSARSGPVTSFGPEGHPAVFGSWMWKGSALLGA